MTTQNDELILLCPVCRKTELTSTSDGVLCSECQQTFQRVQGILSLLPSHGNRELQEVFDRKAGEESESAQSVAYMFQSHHHAMQHAFKILLDDLTTKQDILDVGCGHGQLASIWSETHRIVGIDFSLNMLIKARQKNLEVYHADATALPFADEQFDVAICAEIAQYFDDVTPFLSEMARVVRPGGRILLSTLNAHSLARRSFRAAHKLLPFLSESHFPTTLKTIDNIVTAGKTLPIQKNKVALVYFPFQIVRVFDNPGGLNQRLASNFVIQFQKQ